MHCGFLNSPQKFSCSWRSIAFPWDTPGRFWACPPPSNKSKSRKKQPRKDYPSGKWRRWSRNLTSDRSRTGDKKESSLDPNVRAAIEELERVLGTRVRIVEVTDQRGRIEIEYYSQTDLDRLFQQITGGVN